MPSYEVEDLHIIADPIASIRENPTMYIDRHDQIAGQMLAIRIASDIEWSCSQSVEVKKIGDWWSVSSSTDWLDASGQPLEKLFSTIIPIGNSKDNSFRSEILLTAFATAIVTRSSLGTTWIKGEKEQSGNVPSGLLSMSKDSNRILAFRYVTS